MKNVVMHPKDGRCSTIVNRYLRQCWPSAESHRAVSFTSISQDVAQSEASTATGGLNDSLSSSICQSLHLTPYHGLNLCPWHGLGGIRSTIFLPLNR